MLRIVSLNLNGIRSAATKGAFSWLQSVQPDVVCLQELKAQLSDIPQLPDTPLFSSRAFHPAEKKGYSGVGLLACFSFVILLMFVYHVVMILSHKLTTWSSFASYSAMN